MGDLAVQLPHLGRETIAVLARIVDSQNDGLLQDDIEPYLLVRLLRCGYIRRKESGTPVFVVTQAGIERSRLEGVLAQRRQKEAERREIIRGRVQAMADRLELDRAPPPAVPTLRDLPGYRERQPPPLREPPRPLLRTRALPRPADRGPEAMPEEALRLIRAAEQRARHDDVLPLLGAGDPPALDGGDLPVVHVGRLPQRRAHDGSDAEPLPPEPTFPATVVAEEIDPRHRPLTPDYGAANIGGGTRSGGGWGWAALAATVGVAVVVLAADPFHHWVRSSQETTPQASLAHRPAPATTMAADATPPHAAVETAAVGPPGHKETDSAQLPTVAHEQAQFAETSPKITPETEPIDHGTAASTAAPEPPPPHAASEQASLAAVAPEPQAANAVATAAAVASAAEPATNSAAAPVVPTGSRSAAAETMPTTPLQTKPIIAASASKLLKPPVAAAPPAAAVPPVLALLPAPAAPPVLAIPPAPAAPPLLAMPPAPAAPPVLSMGPVPAAPPVLSMGPVPAAPSVLAMPPVPAAPPVLAMPTVLAAPPVRATPVVTSAVVMSPAGVIPAVVATQPEAPGLVVPPPVVTSPPRLSRAVATAVPITPPELPSAAAAPPRAALVDHHPDHAKSDVRTRRPLAFTDAAVDLHTPHAGAPEVRAALRSIELKRIMEKLRGGEDSGDHMVDRLNALSLQAALHGRIFVPPGAHGRKVIRPERPRQVALP